MGLAASPLAAQTQRNPLDGLDAYIRNAMPQWQVPGLAIAVVRHDSVVYLKGFGVRQVGRPAVVDPQTVFALSSNGKAFTAAAVGILVDEGKLSWDDVVSSHLPAFQLSDPWVTRHATIRDLLAHRVSGDMGSASGQLWFMTGLNRDQVIHGLRYLEPGRYRFRERFEYNNPNILAAGLIVGVVSGSSWDQFMKTRILAPLDMTSATTTVLELWDAGDVAPCYICDLPGRTVSYDRAKIANIAMPHIPTDSGPMAIPWRTVDDIAPAGSINANVTDVAKWVRMQLANGTFGGKRIVSAAALDEMHSPQMIVSDPSDYQGPGFGASLAYGMGWFLSDFEGRKAVHHTGGITGWGSAIAMLPDENLGVAVLTNNQLWDWPNRLAEAVAFTVLDRYVGAPDRNWSAYWLGRVKANMARAEAAERQLADNRVAGTKPSRPLKDLVGVYDHPAFGELVVSDEAGVMAIRFTGVLTGKAERWHYDDYRIKWNGPPTDRDLLSFGIDQAGRVTRAELQGVGTFVRRGK